MESVSWNIFQPVLIPPRCLCSAAVPVPPQQTAVFQDVLTNHSDSVCFLRSIAPVHYKPVDLH